MDAKCFLKGAWSTFPRYLNFENRFDWSFLRSILKVWKISDFFLKNRKKVKIFQRKIIWIFIDFLTFFIFHFFLKNFFFPKKLFWSNPEKLFFGLRKKSWVKLRCRKVRSFDCWCFPIDLRTLANDLSLYTFFPGFANYGYMT